METILDEAAAIRGAMPNDIDIYRYHIDVFIPTDFHTATYHKDDRSGKEYIYIIGGVGYRDGPHRKTTITHRLALEDFSIQRMETTGDTPPPGGHRRARKEGDTIVYMVDEWSEYSLSLTDMRWSHHPTIPEKRHRISSTSQECKIGEA